MSFDDKRQILDLLVTTVEATSDRLDYMENLTGRIPVRPLV